MPEPLYSALFEAARTHDLDVVGHIPGEIPIADAIAAGQRTKCPLRLGKHVHFGGEKAKTPMKYQKISWVS